ncbi:hypothetical protein [Streptomyces sp. NPDC049585]|uniref:hypothetical protein n=1 Tax=Streptomyces sp. NPDC049585 TaxID=3155154 RepID=UPI0034375F7A
MGTGRRGAVTAAAVLALVAGCGVAGGGRGGEGKDEPRADGGPHALAALDRGHLAHVELGAREVPGYAIERASAGSAGSGTPTTRSSACRPLVVALGSRQQPAPVASVVRTFSRTTGDRRFQGLLGTIRVSAYEGDGARATLRGLRTAAGSCAGGFAMRTGEGQPQRFSTVTVLPAPRIGDEAVAYRLVNAAERAPSLVTVVRTGSMLSMFFATHLSDPSAVEIPQALVAAQVAKVERLDRAARPPAVPPSRLPVQAPDEGGEAGAGEAPE